MIPCNIRKSGLSGHARAGFKVHLNPNTSEDANYRRTDETAMQLASNSSKYVFYVITLIVIPKQEKNREQIGEKKFSASRFTQF